MLGVRAGAMIPAGWIVIAANATYYAMLDFLAGCVGLDPRKDDYHKPSANVVANAYIRYIVVCGEESRGQRGLAHLGDLVLERYLFCDADAVLGDRRRAPALPVSRALSPPAHLQPGVCPYHPQPDGGESLLVVRALPVGQCLPTAAR